eukprot:12919223-Prorocentrum_lima.AAC.1
MLTSRATTAPRNHLRRSGRSPAKIVFGRNMRDPTPVFNEDLLAQSHAVVHSLARRAELIRAMAVSALYSLDCAT